MDGKKGMKIKEHKQSLLITNHCATPPNTHIHIPVYIVLS